MTHYGALSGHDQPQQRGVQLPGRTAQPYSYRRAATIRDPTTTTSSSRRHPPHLEGYRPTPVIPPAPKRGVDSDLDSSSSEEESETDFESETESDSDSDEYTDSESENEREYARQQYLKAKAIREQELALAAATAAAAPTKTGQRGGSGRGIYDGPGDRERVRRSRSQSHRESKSRDRERARREERRRSSRGAATTGVTRGTDRSADKSRRNRGDSDPRREKSVDRKKRKKKKMVAAAGVVENEKLRGSARGKKRRGGGGGGGGGGGDDPRSRKPWWKRYRGLLCLAILTILIIIIAVPVGVSVNKKNKGSGSDSGLGVGKSGENPGSILKDEDRAKIPAEERNGYFDPWSWKSTKDLNVTYTKQTVGGLPIMGLFDDYDDSARANSNVPPLKDAFPYGKQPIRGVNLGGWLLLEPFLTPSFFKEYPATSGVVDEYTLSKKWGRNRLPGDMEDHYNTFVTEQTFKEIRDAGLDHVRIPFGYWAIMQLDGDPYLFRVSWRYLLRGIEWARKYGLRVNVDLHSVPGGANGWNHSGRLGKFEWLKGDKGEEYATKTLEIHQKMAEFFAQPRYKNVVTIYGLVNEPRMMDLEADRVIKWTEDAHALVRQQGYEGQIVFGDGFRGLPTWKGEFEGLDKMLLDVHQYTIFNDYHIGLTHEEKINFVCKTWAADMMASSDKVTGFGPTFVGEWSQADTDCAEYLNDVGQGTRWDGTFLDASTRQPNGPSRCDGKKGGSACSCTKANEDPSKYSDAYKKFLLMFAESQMDAFERGWGWMYWTWDTETAHQWSYKKGLAAGIIPKDPSKRGWKCGDEVPDFGKLGLPETY